MMSILIETLSSGAAELGINLTETQLALFEKHYRMMIETNKSFNLTAITDEKEAALKHFVDSLTCLNVLPPQKDIRILDVGSGAGFPGIPLAICRPGLNITMIEAAEKKANFLKKTIEALKLENIEAVHARAEDFGRNKNNREKYDVVVSRAVAALAVLVEYCLPPLRVGGIFVAMKGPNIHVEIKAAEKALTALGGAIKKTVAIQMPFTGDERKLILISKIKASPATFPRRAGMPAKKPL
jgi:16S rRNA (guanine527-N7)-methyltransferase